MFTISDGGGRRDCTGLTRRNFLRVGALGLGGLGLADLLALRARAAATRRHVKDRAVVFLYLAGGPSQIETFDPKMDAPAEIRSMTGEVKTKLPGVTFGGSFPKLAAMADRLAIVRSFVQGNADHDGGRKLLAGVTESTRAALGPVYARLAGAVHPATGMPSNVFLSPASVGHEMEALHEFYYAGISTLGTLPATCAPFHPVFAPGANATRLATNQKAPATGLLADLQLRLPLERLDERRRLLGQLDGLQRQLDDADQGVQALGQYQQQAFDVLRRGISQAFDLSKEDPRTLERYDTSGFKTPAAFLKLEKNGKMKAQSQTALGKQLLLARRLCEAGCGFVTVGMNDWDMHGNFNSFPIPDGMALLGGALDRAVSAFLEDLDERGLSDKVLLVIAGEMGRTPRIVTDKATGRPGRDHWAGLGALLLAGGGLRMGQVIGASDRSAGRPATEPLAPPQLMATIWHTLFDLPETRLVPSVPPELARLVTETAPIPSLLKS